MKQSYGFEVSLNGRKITRAGFAKENYVITCILGAVSRIDESNELYLSIGGLNSLENEYVDWQGSDLKKADNIIIEAIDDNFEQPINIRSSDTFEKHTIEDKLKYFYKLKEELKDYL